MELIKIIIYFSIYIGLVATSFYVISYISSKKEKKLLFSDEELPRVSILIPIYNEEKSIKKTLNSVLASDYPKNKFEVIVIDDGSTDKGLEIAKKFKSKVRIFSKKKNEGKGSALNFGIKKSKGEIIFTMDADTFVDIQSLKNMVRYFKNKRIMSVCPAMVTEKPENLLQRIQYIEYVLGLFLRKAFATINAVHITPGAFSAYRKSFFDKYGGYEENNITEDLEMALRIQYYGYVIENSPESPAYTIAPDKFYDLMKQRRRWYVGLTRNVWKYKKILSPKYGDLGIFVLPVAWISIFLCITVTLYFVFSAISSIRDELILLSNINYDFGNLFNVNFYFLERMTFLLLTNPIIIFIGVFIIIVGFYLFYASRKLGKVYGLAINLPIYFLFFSILFGFWWIVSFFYLLSNKKVSWE